MSKKSSAFANTVKHGYEASVKARALARAGGNPNLNGHILEIMGSDKTNLNPVNWVRGVSEKLTRSTTATTVDSVVMKGGNLQAHARYRHQRPHNKGARARLRIVQERPALESRRMVGQVRRHLGRRNLWRGVGRHQHHRRGERR